MFKKIFFFVCASIIFAQLDYFLVHAMHSDFRLYNPTRLIDSTDWLTKTIAMFLAIYISVTLAKRFGDKFLGVTILFAGYFPVFFTTVFHVAFFSRSGNFFMNIIQMTEKVTMTGPAMIGHLITGALVAITCLIFCRYVDKGTKIDEIAPNFEE